MNFAHLCEKGQLGLNEDASLARPELGLFAISDGLGIHGGGDQASSIALKAIEDAVDDLKETTVGAKTEDKNIRQKFLAKLDAGVQEASKKVFDYANKSKHAGACTTIDVLWLVDRYALFAHCGAGRSYLIRNGELHQLTEDHTQLAHFRRTGKLNNIPVNQHAAYAKKLTRAVGFQDHVKVDLLGVEIQTGDRIVLVSDGVWSSMDENKFLELVKSSNLDLKNICQRIAQEVEKNGAKDNYTIAIIEPPALADSFENGNAEQKIKMLGKVPAFAYLSYQDLIKVISVGDLFKVVKGKTICSEGEQGGEMMLILSGSVDVLKNGQKIRSFSRGDVFGEMSMVDAAPRSASIIAKENTNLLAFPRDALFALFREYPSLAVKFLWGITMETNKRLRVASNQLVGLSEKDVLEYKASGPFPF